VFSPPHEIAAMKKGAGNQEGMCEMEIQNHSLVAEASEDDK
jgi:hypothetical protein